jgi:pyrimidine operon attenuation protein/uracil phosphoribosyltransferase
MIKSLAICVLLAIATATGRGVRLEVPSFSFGLMNAGLIRDAEPSPAEDRLCAQVSLSRGFKYGENDQNLLDVAASTEPPSIPRPVLLFVVDDSFANDDTSADSPLREKILCLSARNGMVGVTISYRRAPKHDWPAAARDIAAAISWVHENIDLFSGDPREIVVIGCSTGAFHLANFLAHRELHIADANVAGAVLLSGTYRSGADADEDERAHSGAETSFYEATSVFPGLLKVEQPIVLAWSTVDSPQVIAQAENLKDRLCAAGHCPRTALLTSRNSPASLFGLDGGGDILAERVRELIEQIESRKPTVRPG